MRQLFTAVGLTVLGAMINQPIAAQAQAQPYPSQPIRIVVPFSPGSGSDVLARNIAEPLSENLKKPVFVENRPGMAGTVAAGTSPGDGYTLMFTSNGHTVVGIVNKNLPFDPAKAFTGVSQVATVPYAMIVPPDFSAKNVAEFIALAKANPGKLNFASSGGVGSSTFIVSTLFRKAANIEVQVVPYRGGPESLTAVMRGDAQVYFGPVNAAFELRNAGKVRVLAVATAERSSVMPDVPTIAESGLPGFTYNAWFGFLAPASTPQQIIARLNSEIARVIARPGFADRLLATGAVPLQSSADAFTRTMLEETEKLRILLKDEF